MPHCMTLPDHPTHCQSRVWPRPRRVSARDEWHASTDQRSLLSHLGRLRPLVRLDSAHCDDAGAAVQWQAVLLRIQVMAVNYMAEAIIALKLVSMPHHDSCFISRNTFLSVQFSSRCLDKKMLNNIVSTLYYFFAPFIRSSDC